MYDSPLYPTPRATEVEAFVAAMRHGTLIATAPGGQPQVSILPFVKTGGQIEVHCIRADPTFAAAQANERVTFFVSDFLAFTPHHFVDPHDAGRATLHFRAVAFECLAECSTDPAEIAATLTRLLADYEPASAYVPLSDPSYAERLARLACLRLTIVNTHAKFKVGPAAPPDVRMHVAGKLRTAGNSRAADLIDEATPKPEP